MFTASVGAVPAATPEILPALVIPMLLLSILWSVTRPVTDSVPTTSVLFTRRLPEMLLLMEEIDVRPFDAEILAPSANTFRIPPVCPSSTEAKMLGPVMDPQLELEFVAS